MVGIMKIVASLFRLLCSLLVLVVIALYVNAPGNPDLNAFAAQLTGEHLLALFSSFNWVSITALVLVAAALLRLLEIAWNMAFCAAMALVLAGSSYMVFGAETALPAAISTNAEVLHFCNLPQTYPVPALIVAGVFALGWLAANAAFRVAFTTILCYALWFGCAVLFYMTADMAANDPALADKETAQSILTFIQAHPWVTAALPGVFFLVYALLMAFFDSFPSSDKKKAEAALAKAKAAVEANEHAKEEAKKETATKTETKPAATTAKPAQTRPLTVAKPTTTRPITAKPAAPAPKLPVKPVLPPVPKPAAPKQETKVEPAPAAKPKPETKAEPAPAAEPKPETKAEPAPAAEPKPEAKAEPAPAAEPKPETKAEPAPAAEPKPETKAEPAPAAEPKPEAKAEPAPAAEPKPAEVPQS